MSYIEFCVLKGEFIGTKHFASIVSILSSLNRSIDHIITEVLNNMMEVVKIPLYQDHTLCPSKKQSG